MINRHLYSLRKMFNAMLIITILKHRKCFFFSLILTSCTLVYLAMAKYEFYKRFKPKIGLVDVVMFSTDEYPSGLSGTAKCYSKERGRGRRLIMVL